MSRPNPNQIRRNAKRAGWVVAIVIAAFSAFQFLANDKTETGAITEAAQKVGDAAQDVGDAAQKAVD